jgi:hypothetical protein
MRSRLPVLLAAVVPVVAWWLGGCTAAGTAGGASDPPHDTREDRFLPAAAEEAQARELRISDELGELGHPWAGRYYCGDGRGENVTLLLAPRSGYVFEWRGCMGLYDRNYGPITERDGRLELGFAFENPQDGWRGIAPVLVPVTWGARRYLVPADDVIGFCNEINMGAEPRTDMHGSYLLRCGDEAFEVSGWPELPDEYCDALLARPIEATVLVVGDMTTRDGLAGTRFTDTTLTLDAGELAGLRVGMDLVVIDPGHAVERARVTKLERDRSEALMTSDGAPFPKAGWRLSTQAPWHAALRKAREGN